MNPRRAALFSTPFLWLIGVALFLPTIKSCEHVESAASLIASDPLPFVPLLSPFLVAELLAISILVPLCLRREPSRRWWLATLAAVVPVFASPATLVYCFGEKPAHLTDHLYALGSLAAALLALVVIVRGAYRSGWARLWSSVAAYTILTLPLAVWFVHMSIEEGVRHDYVGGYFFVTAMLGLVTLTAISIVVPTRRAITRA